MEVLLFLCFAVGQEFEDRYFQRVCQLRQRAERNVDLAVFHPGNVCIVDVASGRQLALAKASFFSDSAKVCTEKAQYIRGLG